MFTLVLNKQVELEKYGKEKLKMNNDDKDDD
jgi:hypothetical protein